MESRILELERTVSDMRADAAESAADIRHLTEAVNKLTVTVDGLSAALNRGRGALWGIGLAASLLGGSAAMAAQKLLGN